jgi:hypothetical protein
MKQDEINAVKKAAKKMRKQESAQGEIIEMAQECGLIGMRPHLDGIYSAHLVAFAKLVAAKEREACAEIAEKQRYAMCISLTSHPAQNGTAVGIANTIRARGKQA